jgi:hypothetical protein
MASANPAHQIKLITPGSSVLSPIPRALYFGVGGTISITNPDDTTEAAIPVVAGGILPVQVKKVTAASGATVYGLYYD